ncbi:MAG: hypothetical protein M3Y93_12875 [Pseudomonadota bacterium]|nr:hypothetical protein [Pseudomonadota bacterium]
MNMQIALRHRSRASWSFDHPGLWWTGIAVLMLLVLGLWLSPTEERGSAARIQPLVHFQDASHDWLLVVDPATAELVVYDANDGRPLHRLGAAEGLSGVKSISSQGSWLFVTSDQHPALRVLKLPQFQPVAVAAH